MDAGSLFNEATQATYGGISPFAVMISLAMAYYVHNDAREHNNPNAAYWALGTFLAWIIFLPLYWFRNMRGRKAS